MNLDHQPGVYEIRNLLNGERYIGGTFNLAQRFTRHVWNLERGRKRPNHRLQRAWNEYGPAAFILRPLLICDRDMVRFFEDAALKNLKPEYNVILEATGDYWNTAWREALSRARRGKKHSAEARAKISRNNVGMKGKKHSAETRAKMSRSHQGRKPSAETREKISQNHVGMRGKTHSAETREKMSRNNGMKGKKHSAEAREKMSRSQRARRQL